MLHSDGSSSRGGRRPTRRYRGHGASLTTPDCFAVVCLEGPASFDALWLAMITAARPHGHPIASATESSQNNLLCKIEYCDNQSELENMFRSLAQPCRLLAFSDPKTDCEKTAKRNGAQSVENNRFREIIDSLLIMISTAYGEQRETLRFVSRKESFRFRCFWSCPRPKRNDSRAMSDGVPAGLGIVAARRPSKWPLAGLIVRSEAQHCVSKGGQKRPTWQCVLGLLSASERRLGKKNCAKAHSSR
jgi:hypothetical protein